MLSPSSPVVLLAGCGVAGTQFHPGLAAEVGDQSITSRHLDQLTSDYCAGFEKISKADPQAGAPAPCATSPTSSRRPGPARRGRAAGRPVRRGADLGLQERPRPDRARDREAVGASEGRLPGDPGSGPAYTRRARPDRRDLAAEAGPTTPRKTPSPRDSSCSRPGSPTTTSRSTPSTPSTSAPPARSTPTCPTRSAIAPRTGSSPHRTPPTPARCPAIWSASTDP